MNNLHPIEALRAVMLLAIGAAAFGVHKHQPAPRAPEPPPDAALRVQSSGVPRLLERLQALTPARPMDYFDLAEEVAFEIPGEEGRRLARTLFVLAHETGARAGMDESLASSVCLALAELSTDDAQKRWLRTLAGAVSVHSTPGASSGGTSVNTTPGARATRLALATALGEFRAGKYRRAADLLKRSEVSDLLTQSRGSIDHADRVLASVSRGASCLECRGDRYVRRPNEGTGYAMCPTCAGNPGPILSPEQFLQELRLESALLDARQQSWGAQVLVDGGKPLIEPDPAELAPAFGVDPARCFWRPGNNPGNPLAGRWVTREEADALDAQP